MTPDRGRRARRPLVPEERPCLLPCGGGCGLVAMVVAAAVGPVAVTTPALATPARRGASSESGTAPTWPSATRCRSASSATRGAVPGPRQLRRLSRAGRRRLAAAPGQRQLPGRDHGELHRRRRPEQRLRRTPSARPSGYRDSFPLHEDYEGSQLDYALEVLEDAAHVRLVTIQLGANDRFLCLRAGSARRRPRCRRWPHQVQENLDPILCTLRDEGDYRRADRRRDLLRAGLRQRGGGGGASSP